MSLIRHPIPITEAIQRVVAQASPGQIDAVPLVAADGRYLAEEIRADHPVPQFDRSMYDGFAVKAADTLNATPDEPQQLKVIEAIPAGALARGRLNPGTAMRIMTGAALPPGADAVVMLEQVREIVRNGETYIQVETPVKPGTNIAHQGEDIPAGSLLIRPGQPIGPGEKAVLATFGYDKVRVYRQPKVTILATGSELLPVEAPLVPGKIRNSNGYMVASQLKRIGAQPEHLGIVPDDFERCYQAVSEALEQGDYVITTGGAAVGDFDFVQPLIERLNFDLLFNKIAMRPGSVTTVAKKGEKWLFGLSGNPAACFVGVELFVRPVIKKALGAVRLHLPRLKAVLGAEIGSTNVFTRLMRAKAIWENDQLVVRPVGLDKSGIISSLVEANCLLVIPAEQRLREGEQVEIISLEEGGILDESDQS